MKTVRERRGLNVEIKNVSSCRLNCSQLDSRRRGGRLFHKRGPVTAKLLSPQLFCVRGAAHVMTLADRRPRRPVSDMSLQ